MKATWKGTVLAESDDTVVVEGNHYFPAAALRREHFRESATHTVCPWKGTASYYDVVVGADVNRDAAWYYPTPKPAAENITARVAFWKGVQVAALAALLLFAARPASALDNLDGTWGGRISCEGIDDGARTRVKEVVLVGIDDAGDGSIAITLDTFDFLGRVETEAARPDQGVVFATSCEFDAFTNVGAVLHGEVRTKPGSVRASFSGTLIIMNGPGGEATRCELKLERIDPTEPSIAC